MGPRGPHQTCAPSRCRACPSSAPGTSSHPPRCTACWAGKSTNGRLLRISQKIWEIPIKRSYILLFLLPHLLSKSPGLMSGELAKEMRFNSLIFEFSDNTALLLAPASGTLLFKCPCSRWNTLCFENYICGKCSSFKNLSHLLEKESSSLSEGHEVMLKAEGMLRENMGSSIWSRGNVVARSFLSARVGAMPRGRVRDGERVRLSGLVSTIFISLSSLSQKLTGCFG